MITVAIGPVTKVPSWSWVGLDTAKELSEHYNVITYKDQSRPPDASVIIVVKQPPSYTFLKRAHSNLSRIIYCPIDYFETKKQLEDCESVLKQCTMILSHSTSLNKYFSCYALTANVEHHLKYVLPSMAPYKEDGYALWIGGFQFVPYVFQWLNKNKLPIEIKLLTDYKNPSAVGRANCLARELGVKLDISKYDVHEWSEERQAQMMIEAKAAIDIKGKDFMQINKPATKGQKFICSGVPFAVNDISHTFRYFKARNFNICTPLEIERWLSEEYWQETVKFGKQLKKDLSLENVGKQYQTFIKKCLEQTFPSRQQRQNNKKYIGGRKIPPRQVHRQNIVVSKVKRSRGVGPQDIKKLK
jgi:hypothetical protein